MRTLLFDISKQYVFISFFLCAIKESYYSRVYIFVLFDKYALPVISVKEVNIKYDGFIRVIQADINIPRGKSIGALLNRTGNLLSHHFQNQR